MIEKAVTALGLAASIMLIGASMAINAEFAYSRGVTEHQAITYAGAAAAADLLKSLFAFFALRSLEAGGYMRAAASIAFAALVTIYSLSSAIGLIAESRDARAMDRQTRNASHVDVSRLRSEAETELRRIKSHRSVTEVEAAIHAKRASPIVVGARVKGTLAQVSNDCEVPNRATRESCVELGDLREELGRAKAAERLKNDIQELRREQKDLSQKGAGREPDGQVRALAGMLRREIGEMNLALAVLLALVIEAGSSLGLFVSTGHKLASPSMRDRSKDADVDAERAHPARMIAAPPLASLPALSVEEYWMNRLFPAPGQKATLSDIFADYRAYCVRQARAGLEADTFKSTFEEICRQIRLKTAGGFALGVRIGEGAPT